MQVSRLATEPARDALRARPETLPADPWRRHQLVHLTAAGWAAALAEPHDASAGACLSHWAEHDLPLVVVRQRESFEGSPMPDHLPTLALGLPIPTRWGRRALSLRVQTDHLAKPRGFPRLADVADTLPHILRAPLTQLARALHQLQVPAHVYGSLGWQQLTGLRYQHVHSDLDLWLGVTHAQRADAVVDLLQSCRANIRIDGELVGPDGLAVAWREWQAWRAGHCKQVLVKHLHGLRLLGTASAEDSGWLLS